MLANRSNHVSSDKLQSRSSENVMATCSDCHLKVGGTLWLPAAVLVPKATQGSGAGFPFFVCLFLCLLMCLFNRGDPVGTNSSKILCLMFVYVLFYVNLCQD